MYAEGREFEYYSQVEPKKVEWLWYPYIPYGKLTLLQGDPGEGKSTFLLNLAAILSVGGQLPTGKSFEGPQQVIYQCAEDSISDTIKPRLMAAGADCDRIAYIIDNGTDLTLDDERIENTIVETGARLFVIDPIQAFIPPDADMLSAQKMRAVLRKLGQVAERHNCAIVLVGHMNKGNGSKKLYRSLGSIDIVAIARSVLMISRDQNDPLTRYVYPVKSSLAPEADAIGFRIGPDSGFTWLGQCHMEKPSVDEFPLTKTETAKKALAELLSEGDLPSSSIMARLQALGIGERTVQQAKSEMDIRAYRDSTTWYWHLVSTDD